MGIRIVLRRTMSSAFGVLLFIFALVINYSPIRAQSTSEESRGEISGYTFGDFYWIATNHDKDIKDNNGFWIRRVYFTYDQKINNSFSTRFRLEANSEGDFITENKLTPVIKDLYVKWKGDRNEVLGGVSSTPTWGLVENVWGYRSIEKSPLDLLKMGSSRDLGISVKGNIDSNEKFKYHFMFGNGSSNKSEINQGKKLMGSISYMLTDHIVFQAYADWNDKDKNDDWITFQGFAAYQANDFNLGLLYAHQNRRIVGSDLNINVVSAFTNFAVSDQTRGYIRLDHTFDAIPGIQKNDYFPISNQAEATIVITGLDFELASDVHVMPNVEVATYGDGFNANNQPDTDFIPRVTFYYIF